MGNDRNLVVRPDGRLVNVVLLLFDGRALWFHSLNSDALVLALYDHVEAMLGPTVAGRGRPRWRSSWRSISSRRRPGSRARTM